MSLPTFTLDNLTALNEAIAAGARKVKYADKEVEYNNLDDMLKLRNLMMAEISPSGKKPGGRVYMNFNNGLNG